MKNRVDKFRQHPLRNAILLFIAIFALWSFVAFLPFVRYFFHPILLAGGEKHYLVLLQNNYELRPTGGFISAFGILRVKNGIPTDFNLEDVYGTVDDHGYSAPPYPLGQLLSHPDYQGHTFRDANFDPHFPATVESLELFLRKTRPFQKVDGVIAVDFGFVENWIDAVGTVEVDGREFTADSLLEYVEAIVADVDLHSLDDLPQRKEGVKKLGKKLALKTILPWKLPKFFSAVKKSFNEKHSLFFFHDKKLQSITSDKKWGGELNFPDGEDFLAIVDSNYGGGKANRYVTRSIFYDVDLENGISELDIRYDHLNDISVPLSLNYRGYVRAYLSNQHGIISEPLKNDVIRGNEEEPQEPYYSVRRQGDDEVDEVVRVFQRFTSNVQKGAAHGLHFGGRTFEVPANTQRTTSFSFNFPTSLFDQLSYTLNLWKQPGTYNDFYSISIKVPTGMRISSKDFEVRDNVAIFRGQLTEDMRLTFVMKGDELPPRAIRQEVKSLNLLEIEWNEGIDLRSLRPEKWTANDTDFASPRHDILSVQSAGIVGNTLRVFLNGMTRQPEERYILEVEGIRDLRGNSLGKRTYSFFQRL